MTKEELKEAIASTIVENGQKAITATALANLLNEIVDAAGEGGSGGGGSLTLELDAGLEGPSEYNASFYSMLYEGMYNERKGYHVCLISEGMCASVLQYMHYVIEDVIDCIALIIGNPGSDEDIILFNSDGSMSFVE